MPPIKPPVMLSREDQAALIAQRKLVDRVYYENFQVHYRRTPVTDHPIARWSQAFDAWLLDQIKDEAALVAWGEHRGRGGRGRKRG